MSTYFVLFTFYWPSGLEKRSPKSQVEGSSPGMSYVLLTANAENYTKIDLFSGENSDTLLLKFTELTSSGLESQYKLCFSIFNSKKYRKVGFFQTSKSTPCYEYFEPYEPRRLWSFLACFQ